MGRSNSCFKIITCGSDSADQNDLDLSEGKGSHDKRGWSFRKRSARHRVLSNTVTSETPSSANKESPESANLNFQPQIISTIPEKPSLPLSTVEKPSLPLSTDEKPSLPLSTDEKPSLPLSTDEKPKLSVPVEAKVVDTIVVAKSDNNADVQWDESVIIVLQTAVRRFMAQKEILRLRNVVKLQAAVRGHLVRRHAVGSLRCVQAICKMQALVRARQARGSEKFDGKDGSSLKALGKENIVTYTSLEKLLSNRFAQQLLDSTPKDRPIHIKCDPLKPNSAWIWLERWMSSAASPAPSPAPSPAKKPELIAEEQQASKDEKCPPQVEAEIPSEIISRSADLKSNDSEVVLSSESEENLITYEAENFKFQTGHLSSSSRDNLELSQPENTSSSDMKDSPVHTNQPIHSDVNFQTELDFLPSMPEMCTEQPKQSMKPLASEERETETKKSVLTSKKASNPAFIAAQTKFEGLSSTANSGRSISLDVGVEPGMDTASSGVDTVFRSKDLIIAENTAPNNPRVQVGGSECGTELSISSTLDSPDISEAGVTEYENEAKVSEGSHNPNIMQKHELGANDALDIPVSNSSQPASDQPEKREDITDASVTSIVTVDSSPVNQKPERSTSDLQQEVVLETSLHAYKSSPEASPRSHMTVPESQGTPSSQVSVKPTRSKTNKSGSKRKPKSLSSAKGSPSSHNHDSGARSSTEQLPSDQKGGKRRNSFGSVKPDQVDQEPRDSSSSLPHFMQATQSARAKLNANNSPRSSPDMQDTELYIKKRHSLPGTNGRQGSPRIQRSMSQVQQGAKGNGTNSNERKWQR